MSATASDPREMLRTGALLTAYAIAVAAMLAGAHWATRDAITRAGTERLVRELGELVPPSTYDNDIVHDLITVSDEALGGRATVYRARKGGAPVAAILGTTAPDGYSGPISLLIGVRTDGTLAGVRVTAHKETPGLGDKITLDHGDWILSFSNRSLVNPPPARWAVRKDGGDFDQFTGATITPRAIVKAVRRTLEYFSSHHAALFAAPTDEPHP